MKSKYITLFLLYNSFILNAQLTIRVTSIPFNTPANTPIHVVGDFNKWTLNDPATRLKRQPDGSYAVTLNPAKTLSMNYKFNRGQLTSWEGKEDGSLMQSRTLVYDEKPLIVNHEIAGWENEKPNSTADANVRLVSNDFLMPQLKRKKRIWVYLPPNYETDTTTRFPVLYMAHGQHLFDLETSGKEEWKIDETMNALFNKGDKGCIIVGIEGQNKDNDAEYAPWIAPKQQNTDLSRDNREGVAYADFIVKTLKPYIDNQFRTKKTRSFTAVGGSLMAANEALYIATTYQNVFSKAALFSPLLSYSDSCLMHVKQKGKQKSMRYYIVSGTDEDVTKTAAIDKMAALLRELGYGKEELKVVKKIDGEPTEWFWSREFEDTYKWLYRDMTAQDEEGIFDETVNVQVASNLLTIETSENLTYANIQLFDNRQKLLFMGALDAKNIVNIGFLQSGNYIIHAVRGNEVLFVKSFVKK
jgi:predicted alpha/beta superfamily hydrolase